MKKLFLFIASLMLMVSCNTRYSDQQTQQQDEQTVEVTTPFNFSEPQEIECSDCYTIFQTIGEDYGLAKSIKSPTLVLLVTNGVCYDEMQICENDSTKFMMIGTYEYQSIDSLYRTVPVLRLYDKTE